MISQGWSDEDDQEAEYGTWHVFDAKDTLEEDRKVHPAPVDDESWPDWADGVPTIFKRTFYSPPFSSGYADHEAGTYTRSIILDWCLARDLALLRKNYGYLPSDRSSHWTGVYRLFSKGAVIERCCGSDPSGTLYVGMAGTGKQSWSILRNRLMQLAKCEHHATSHWSGSDRLRTKFPWESLAVEWAYTPAFIDYDGKQRPGAVIAERWLLVSYRESFGELPPWNKK